MESIGIFRQVLRQKNPVVELTGESVGIDVGIKDLAVCSNAMTFKNINKTKLVKNLGKKDCVGCNAKYQKI